MGSRLVGLTSRSWRRYAAGTSVPSLRSITAAPKLGDTCFGGDGGFSFSDAAAYSGGGGDFGGGDGGRGGD